jgi:DNA-binding LacI/PurR family transcriptional regulator
MRATCAATRMPATVEPLGDIMPTSECEDRVQSTVGSSPFTGLNTPDGVPASSRIPVKLRAFRGAISFDFSTAVQPASGAAATRLRSFLSLAPSLGLRGICLATTDRVSQELDATLAELQRGGLKILSVAQRLDERGIPSIVHEEYAASRFAVRRLLETGHSSTLYVGRINSSALGAERYLGYRAAPAKANQPLQREFVHYAVFSYAAGPDTVNRGLDAGTVFRGVQAGSDLIALGAMAALHARGLRVPEDVGVIGFGNADWTAHVCPAMTTLSVRHEATAIAVRSAFESMETGGDVRMLVTIAWSLIIRQSA